MKIYKKITALVAGVAMIFGISNYAFAATPISAPKNVALEVNQSKKITIKGKNIISMKYKSMDTQIVEVNKKGKLTAKKDGKCKVKITIKYRKSKKAKRIIKKNFYCTVSVKDKTAIPTENETAAPVSTIAPSAAVSPTTAPSAETTTVPIPMPIYTGTFVPSSTLAPTTAGPMSTPCK